MNKHIAVSQGILFGKPRVKGTRISVEQVLACLSEGWSYKEIMKEFGLTEKQILACLEYAHHSLSHTYFIFSSGKAHVQISH